MITSFISFRFHPDFHDSNSKVQRDMLEYIHKWVQSLGHRQEEVIGRLSKESVRNHQNIRLAGDGGAPAADGSFAQNAAHQAQHDIQGYVSSIPVVGSAANYLGNASSSGPGGGGGGHSHGGGMMSQIPGVGNMMGKFGEAQSFMNQFGGQGGPGGRREMTPPRFPGSSYGAGGGPSMPPRPEGGSTYPDQSAYPVSSGGQPAFPGGPSYPGGPSQSYGPPPTSATSFPGAGYASSYDASYDLPQAEQRPGYSGYGQGSYPPPAGPPSFPGSGPGFPDAPGGGPGFPGSDPYGAAPPSFPGSQPGGFGYNDPPQGRPWGW